MTKFGRLLLLLVVFPIYSNAFEFPYKTYSCFNGDFASIDSLLQSVKKQYTRNNRDVSTIDAEQITARYNKWKNMDQQEIDCKYFEYIVDSIPVTGFYVMPKGENIGDLVPVIFNRGGNADSVIRTPYFLRKVGTIFKERFFRARKFL